MSFVVHGVAIDIGRRHMSSPMNRFNTTKTILTALFTHDEQKVGRNKNPNTLMRQKFRRTSDASTCIHFSVSIARPRFSSFRKI